MAADKKIEHIPNKAIKSSNFKAQNHYFNTWSVSVPHGVKPDMLADYAMWRHVADKLRPYDQIYVVAEDSSFWAHLLVVQSEPRVGAVIKILDKISLNDNAASDMPKEADEYEIKHRGFAGWCIIRKKDNTRLFDKEKFESESEAQKELSRYLQSLRA